MIVNEIKQNYAPMNVIEKFDFQSPETDPILLSRTLAENMMTFNGLGLSAPQIGLDYRCFVILSDPIIACFNPIIVDQSSESIILEETCLSYKKALLKVKRPRTIKVRYTEPNGNVVTRTFDGLTSRIFQHQLDYLNGSTMWDHAISYHKEMAKKKMKQKEI